MKITRTIGRAIKPFVNFPRWMGLSALVQNFKNIKTNFLDLTQTRQAERKESFAQAVKRLKLTDADLKRQASGYFIRSLIYFLITMVLCVYTIYLFSHVRIAPGLIAVLVTAVAAVYTYRENFYYFQIKQRKLGCTFKEWMRFCLRGFKS